LAHQHEAGAQRIAAHPRADAERARRARRLREHPLAAVPALLELDVITPAHAPDPAPAQALDLAIERHLETRVRDDDRCRRGRQQGGQALQEAMLHLAVAQVLLRMDLLIQGQTATPHRQRGAQQVQRLIPLEVTPVDHDQRLSHAGEQHPAQRAIDRAAVALQMAVA
jgi:hypothetical protein